MSQLSPENAGGVLGEYADECFDVRSWGGIFELVPPDVPVAPVQVPALLSQTKPELRDRGLCPFRTDPLLPRWPFLDHRHVRPANHNRETQLGVEAGRNARIAQFPEYLFSVTTGELGQHRCHDIAPP